MTSQILASELSNLIQESKRKHAALRAAAEKSLDELKALRVTSEAQIAADLSQRPNFVTPFLVACGTKNVKFTGIAVVCLQRLVVSRGLPRSRLSEVLDAFRDATSAGVDVQLKILQALPSLLQNYTDELKGDYLGAALNICSVLQSSKNGIVNNTAAATLQQLVVSVFDRVVLEDKRVLELPTVGEVPSEDGPIQLRASALDAHRVFNDICLLTEAQKPRFLKFVGLPQTFGLELIESVLTNHAAIFLTHPEQANILRTRVMPFIISSLSEKLTFATTVRIVRVLYTILKRHLEILIAEAEVALGLLTHMLDPDTSTWKRALCMEVFRGVFGEATLVRRIFALYDAQEGKKTIVRDLVATFVRLSTEKPQVIGLGQQSTMPVDGQHSRNSSSNDQAMLEASGVPGIVSSSVSSITSGGHSTGISTQWSLMRVPCIDQLDKTDPPSIPESYVYSLTLACINSFSEGLAKFILPMTVPGESRSRKKLSRVNEVAAESETAGDGRALSTDRTSEPDNSDPRKRLERRGSTRKRNPIPVNPLTLEDHPLIGEVKICAAIIDECWPAILATCSTFLYAALDSEYYHGLVRAFQKFTHVAGLLRLSTPRDAFLTTLGKAAVPPNVFTASISTISTPSTPTTESSSMFSNAKGLLSVESLVSSSSTNDRRQSTSESAVPSLNTRNLLCLRALLNLGIALGPTLGQAWLIIIETLQQADFVLFSTNRPGIKAGVSTLPKSDIDHDTTSLMANFSNEVKAVETAATRLFESTVDFPDESFVEIITAFCKLFGAVDAFTVPEMPMSPGFPPSPLTPRKVSQTHRRLHSSSVAPTIQNQGDHFALAKLGEIASINIDRLITSDSESSGWDVFTFELISTATSSMVGAAVRLRAAETLVKVVLEVATLAVSLPDDRRIPTHERLLDAFRRGISPLQLDSRESSVSAQAIDMDVHKIFLDGFKSVLEQCGETLVSGWEIAFEIMDSVFLRPAHPQNADVGKSKRSPSISRSARLIRSSFSSLQLICSDFLNSLPSSCFVNLVDSLYSFSTQDDDLNICLTTVTFFWVLSDFISSRTISFTLDSDILQDVDEDGLVKKLFSSNPQSSDGTLWLFLLLRLTAVTSDDRLEVRNSAVQTLLRIFDAYGDDLTPGSWSLCLDSVIFKLLASIEKYLDGSRDRASLTTETEVKGWYETTIVVLQGISDLLATYMNVIASHSDFAGSWKRLLEYFSALLTFESLEVNTAVFKALKHLLSHGNRETDSRRYFDNGSITLAWTLWSQKIPLLEATQGVTRKNNQDCLISYVSSLHEIYRLMNDDLEISQVCRMLTLLGDAVKEASAAAYSADIEYLTPLQTLVLESMKAIRTDIDGVPAAIISQVAEFVALPFKTRERPASSSQGPTYIALSKGSMALIESLITSHATDKSIYTSRAVTSTLTALSEPLVAKYAFPIKTKSVPPWRQATETSLCVLKAIIPTISGTSLPEDIQRAIWSSVITIVNGITTADCAIAPGSLYDDQDFDIASFRTLRELIIPALGGSVITDRTRRLYTESLFHTSLIHAPGPQELPQPNQELLAGLYKFRKGKTIDPPPSQRSKMSYICFDELISLVAAHDSSPTRVKLAQAAAPYLILRAGLTLLSYIADQPLRGRMPQPLSQRKELIYILKALVELQSEPEAIPDASGVESEGRKHLHRLYPLLCRAVRSAARDQEVLEWLTRALNEVGDEFGL